MADVLGGRPVAAEVAALDHQVGRHQDVPGLHPEHGRVVARPDQDVLPLPETLHQCADQAELAGVGEGGVGREGMAPSHQITRPLESSGTADGHYRHPPPAR